MGPWRPTNGVFAAPSGVHHGYTERRRASWRAICWSRPELGGAALERKVRIRIEAGQRGFYVVVPMIEPGAGGVVMLPDDPAFGVTGQEDRTEDSMQQARDRSEQRLRRMIDKVESLGGVADGEVGATDAIDA